MHRPLLARRKTYVAVEALHRADGMILPTAIHWEGGRVFDVRKVISSSRLPGKGDPVFRYKVLVSGKETYLYTDRARWWVDAKVYGKTYGRGGDYDDSGDVAGTYGRVWEK